MKKVQLHLSKVEIRDDDLVAKLQGFLMSRISADFADFLHEQETNPYSLNLYSTREKMIWTVNLLAQEAEEEILPQLLDLKEIQLNTYSESISVKGLEIQTLSQQSLLEVFQEDNPSSIVYIHFYTPTTFKRQGEVCALSRYALDFSKSHAKIQQIDRRKIRDRGRNFTIFGRPQPD